VVSSGRLGPWARASAGTRVGTSGTKSGPAHLPGAFTDATVWCLRDHPPAPTDLARVEPHQANGNALTGLAPQVARAIEDRRTRHLACAKAPGAALNTPGRHRPDALDPAASRAALHAQARLGREPLRPARCLDRRSRA
jgi:hypothetical protein